MVPTDISSLHVLVISISAEKWCSFTILNIPEQIVTRNLAHITTLNNVKILLYTFYTTPCVQITLKTAITQQFGNEYRKHTPHAHEWRDLASFPSILIKCRSTTHTCEISLEYTILLTYLWPFTPLSTNTYSTRVFLPHFILSFVQCNRLTCYHTKFPLYE